jgi:hypothetical protein
MKLTLVVCLLLAIGGCAKRQPDLVDSKFRHANFPTCSMCHEKDRKTPTHNAGRDCAACHSEKQGGSWSKSPHPTNSGLTTCSSCHEKDRPGHDSYFFPDPYSHGVNKDCSDCHQPKGTVVYYKWKYDPTNPEADMWGWARDKSGPSVVAAHFKSPEEVFQMDYMRTERVGCSDCHPSY